MTQISRTAGIDTSKAKLDVAVHECDERCQVDNTAAGWQRLAAAELCRTGSRGRARVERFDVAVGNAVIFANAFKPHDAGAGVVR